MTHVACRPHDWPGQLTSGDRYGSYNCAAYALAKGLEFDTCGRVKRTGAQIRALTNEPIPDPSSPGLHHGQLRDVAAKFGVRLDVAYGVPWSQVRDLNRDRAILLSINYRPIQLTSFSGQRTFSGNHEILLLPELFTWDPLADGRRPGVFRGPAVYPETLLMQAAGAMPGAGFGRANVAVFPTRHPLVAAPAPKPVVTQPTPWNGKEQNVAILTAYPGHTFTLAKGQPLYRHPSGPVVTTMSRDGAVEYIGKAGAGWVAVKVGTSALYADGIVRPTVLYAPSGAGVLA